MKLAKHFLIQEEGSFFFKELFSFFFCMTNKNIEKISIPMHANSVGLWVSHLGSGDKVRGRQLWLMGDG